MRLESGLVPAMVYPHLLCKILVLHLVPVILEVGLRFWEMRVDDIEGVV